MAALKRTTIRVTMVALVCALFFAFGFKGGSWTSEYLVRAENDFLIPPAPPRIPSKIEHEPLSGRWAEYRPAPGTTTPLGVQLEDMSKITSMGYVQGSEEARAEAVVTRYAPGKEYGFLTLVVSGHAPGADLIDMDGNVVYSWTCTFDEVWPGRAVKVETSKYFWRRAHLYPDGSIVGIFEYLGAVKLDAQSRVVWAKDNAFNHDISLADDGTIYMLEQKPTKRPAVNADLEIMDDHVTRLTPDGDIIDSVSLVDCVLNSPCSSLMDRLLLETADIFHSNTVKVITAEQARAWPAARPGMVLVSLREINTIALIDLAAPKVVWWSSDITRYQHDPAVTPAGHILVFDNIWCPGRSRVVEIDPRSGGIAWQYTGTPQRPFFSFTCSTVQYLPNGNRLVTVSDAGRAFSLDPDSNIIWEYVNPHRAGANGELIATLFQCERLPQNFPVGWIARQLQPKAATVLDARAST